MTERSAGRAEQAGRRALTGRAAPVTGGGRTAAAMAAHPAGPGGGRVTGASITVDGGHTP